MTAYHLGEIHLAWPVVLGCKTVTWDDIFSLVKRPQFLWSVYQPSKTLENFNVHDLWQAWTAGEPCLDEVGYQVGLKPPLRELEERFAHRWRPGKKVSKSASIGDFSYMSIAPGSADLETAS
jgi:hypothetical protein